MAEEKSTPRKGFEDNSPRPGPRTGALMIDVQLGCIDMMDHDDAKAYLDQLGETITELREKNIPITWVTIGDNNKLYEPTKIESENLRSSLEIEEMGFLATDPRKESPNKEIFEQFLQEQGPREDEAVYCKYFKSAFATPADALDSEGNTTKANYKKALEDERPGTDGNPGDLHTIQQELFQNQTGLEDHLKKGGIDEILIMGAVSTNCVLETGIDGARKGFKSHVLNDLTISWRGDENETPEEDKRPEYIKEGLGWSQMKTEGSSIEQPHQEKVIDKLKKIVEEAKERNYTRDDISAISASLSITTSTDFLAGQHWSKEPLNSQIVSKNINKIGSNSMDEDKVNDAVLAVIDEMGRAAQEQEPNHELTGTCYSFSHAAPNAPEDVVNAEFERALEKFLEKERIELAEKELEKVGRDVLEISHGHVKDLPGQDFRDSNQFKVTGIEAAENTINTHKQQVQEAYKQTRPGGTKLGASHKKM